MFVHLQTAITSFKARMSYLAGAHHEFMANKTVRSPGLKAAEVHVRTDLSGSMSFLSIVSLPDVGRGASSAHLAWLPRPSKL